jgi:serine/threonine protein kinase
VAPELLRNEPFDGYAVDLWAAGVMLFTMLFGAGALFAAPVAEDRKFRMICEGNLRELVRERQASWDAPMTTSSEPPSPEGASSSGVSNSAVDLLQHMLRPDPSARLTLSEVVRHEWVTM